MQNEEKKAWITPEIIPSAIENTDGASIPGVSEVSVFYS